MALATCSRAIVRFTLTAFGRSSFKDIGANAVALPLLDAVGTA